MPEIRGQHLVIFGGVSGTRTSLIEFYCAESREWKYWKPITNALDVLDNNFTSVVWKNEIYVIRIRYPICAYGGRVVSTPVEIFKYNIISQEYEILSSLDIPSKICSAFAVDDITNGGVYICSDREACR